MRRRYDFSQGKYGKYWTERDHNYYHARMRWLTVAACVIVGVSLIVHFQWLVLLAWFSILWSTVKIWRMPNWPDMAARNMEENPALYDVAKETCHEFGVPWTDPRTGVTYPPPEKKQ